MKTWYISFFAGAIFLISISPADAYLDPGTGSIILQAVIGVIASVGVALKVYWSKIKELGSKLFHSDGDKP